ncbi:RNA polymerase sigma factor [Anabaena azotica]|uniref:RNA polymerase sigma factor n=1 Tax=Anabaena azotica TaxID=197653 RepID=UPI0018EFBDD3|nr:RNA polymerase sigma factor [Anabaena azotica]
MNLLPKPNQNQSLSENNCREFWQIWESSQDYFYKCCLNWMGGNSHDAEDALNQAMLKAWHGWTKSATKITYPKAWLARIIYNYCMDVHRKRQREAPEIENIDDIKIADNPAFTCGKEIPENNILALEMRVYLRHRIESLPERLRYPFILHCCQEKSYPDIAKQLAISEANVRRRIQEARKILQKQLQKYLAGEDNTYIDSCSPSLKKVNQMEEKFQVDETLPYETLHERQAQGGAEICNCDSSIPTKHQQSEINYKLTVICLENLTPHWYSSLNSLEWN